MNPRRLRLRTLARGSSGNEARGALRSSESASDERTRKLPQRPAQPPSRRLEPTVKRVVELPNDVPLTTPSTGAAHRPLPPRADKDPRHSAGARAGPETLGDSDALDGSLIVELAVAGTVFVNGTAAGHGTRVVLTALDRFARHALRVEAEGCLIWHGTVLLDGREVAKVRPVLKPRV